MNLEARYQGALCHRSGPKEQSLRWGISEQDIDQGCSREQHLLKGGEGGRIWMREIKAVIQTQQSPQAMTLWSWDVYQVCPKPGRTPSPSIRHWTRVPRAKQDFSAETSPQESYNLTRK